MSSLKVLESLEVLETKKVTLVVLPDKPFDCKIWPLRIMSKDNALVIALTPTCSAIGTTPGAALLSLVKEGLGRQIYDYTRLHPYVIKPYRPGFPILMTFA